MIFKQTVEHTGGISYIKQSSIALEIRKSNIQCHVTTMLYYAPKKYKKHKMIWCRLIKFLVSSKIFTTEMLQMWLSLCQSHQNLQFIFATIYGVNET